MKNKVLKLFGILFIIIILSFIYAQQGLFGDSTNLPYICSGDSCTPNNKYDSSKPSNFGPELGLSVDIIVKNGRNVLPFVKEKSLLLNKDETVKIKDNEYNLAKDSKLVFETSGELKDGTLIIAGKGGGKYVVKGVSISLPEGGKILIKDGKVLVTLPEGSEIKEPEIKDIKTAEGLNIEYKAEKGKLKLPSGDLFDGTLNYEIKSGKGQYYSLDKILTFGKILIDNNEGKRIDLYFDGERHESGNKVVSLGKEKLSLQNGASATFESGNRILERMNNKHYVSISAKEKSSVTITKRGEIIPLIETYGDFILYDGKEKLFTGLDREKRMDIMKDPITSGKTGELAYPLEMINYAQDGKELLWKDAKKKLVVDENGNWGVVDLNDPLKKFSNYGLKEDGIVTPPVTPVTPVTPPSSSSEPPRVTIIPVTTPPIVTPPVTPPVNPPVNTRKFEPLAAYRNLFFYENGQLKTAEDESPYLATGVRTINYQNLNNPNAEIRIKFGAEWCPACRDLDSEIENKLQKDGKTYVIINVDKNPSLAKQFGYSGGGIPQVTTWVNGKNKRTGWGGY